MRKGGFSEHVAREKIVRRRVENHVASDGAAGMREVAPENVRKETFHRLRKHILAYPHVHAVQLQSLTHFRYDEREGGRAGYHAEAQFFGLAQNGAAPAIPPRERQPAITWEHGSSAELAQSIAAVYAYYSADIVQEYAQHLQREEAPADALRQCLGRAMLDTVSAHREIMQRIRQSVADLDASGAELTSAQHRMREAQHRHDASKRMAQRAAVAIGYAAGDPLRAQVYMRNGALMDDAYAIAALAVAMQERAADINAVMRVVRAAQEDQSDNTERITALWQELREGVDGIPDIESVRLLTAEDLAMVRDAMLHAQPPIAREHITHIVRELVFYSLRTIRDECAVRNYAQSQDVAEAGVVAALSHYVNKLRSDYNALSTARDHVRQLERAITERRDALQRLQDMLRALPVPECAHTVTYSDAVDVQTLFRASEDSVAEEEGHAVTLSIVPLTQMYPDYDLNTDGVIAARLGRRIAFIPFDLKYSSTAQSEYRGITGDIVPVRRSNGAAHVVRFFIADGERDVPRITFSAQRDARAVVERMAQTLLRALARGESMPAPTEDGNVPVYVFDADALQDRER